MPKKRTVNLTFPVGGLHRAWAFQTQPPYTTPDCLNVIPREAIRGRGRGGSRPGASRAYYTQLGGGNPIRLLNTVGYIATNGLTFWHDTFNGANLGAWTAATWIDASLPSVLPDDYADVAYNTSRGAVRSAANVTDFNTTLPYTLGIFIAPYAGKHQGKYQIFGGMTNGGLTATTNGFVVELVMEDATGAYSGTIKTYAGGALINTYNLTSGSTSSVDAGWFTVLCTPGGGEVSSITVYWQGVAIKTQSIAGDLAGSGHAFGFGMNCTQASGICLVDEFRLEYYPNTNAQVLQQPLVASANGLLYRDSWQNTLAAVTTTLTLASDRQIMSGERLQLLYIADHGNPRQTQSSSGAGVVGAGPILDDAGVTDWTTLGIDTDDDVVVITDVTGAAGGFVAGTYTISTVHATNGLTLTGGAAGTCATCNYRVERGPKIYDPALATLTLWRATASLGQVPTGCPLLAVYNDRLVLAGDPASGGRGWYMSRAGAPLDWDFGAASTDGARAIPGSQIDSGQLSEALTCLAAHASDYLLFGCANTLWMLRGDPAYGGRITNLSRNVGVVGPRAWCFAPSGEFVFLSHNGLYALAPGASSFPQSISWERMPRELQNLDTQQYTVSMSWDARLRGVWVFLTPTTATQELHWFLDWETRGFFPMRLPGTMDPGTALNYISASAPESAMLMGCRDGYVRRFREDQETDETTAITNYVNIGPYPVSPPGLDGLTNSLVAVMGEDGGDVTGSIYVGKTPEAAVNASAYGSKTWTEGLNYTFRPRARGAAMIVRIAGSGTRRWAMERVTAECEVLGIQRKA